MRLYYNIWRSGMRITTLREPDIEPVHAPEPVLATFLDSDWYDPFARLSREAQWLVFQHLVAYAHWTMKLSGPALNSWVISQLPRLYGLAVWAQVLSWAVLLIVPYLICLWLNPAVTEGVENHRWGTDFMMRHQGRLWHARFMAFTPRGRPWFTRGPEVGQVLVRERHNVTYGGLWGDNWEFVGLWIEKRGGWPIYETNIWWWGMMGWVGYLTQSSPGVYILQPPYIGNMPML